MAAFFNPLPCLEADPLKGSKTPALKLESEEIFISLVSELKSFIPPLSITFLEEEHEISIKLTKNNPKYLNTCFLSQNIKQSTLCCN